MIAYVNSISDIAVNDYNIGTYIIANGNLYRVVQHINQYDPFQVGVNIVQTTVSAELISLKTAIDQMNTVTNVPITPSIGSNYANYGNSFYEVYGRLVRLHLGLSGVSPTSSFVTVTTLPAEIRPSTNLAFVGYGPGVATNSFLNINATTGAVQIYTASGYSQFDVMWFI